MKYFISILLFLTTAQALAIRYGQDERIFTCTSTSEATQISANQLFLVHVVGSSTTDGNPSFRRQNTAG